MNAESNSGYDCPVKINKTYKHSLFVKAHKYLCTFHGTLHIQSFLLITFNSTCVRKRDPVCVLDNEQVSSSN